MSPVKKTYGGRGQEWHPEFIEYVNFIAKHSAYKGMPDAFTDEGLVQWEAPSNRSSGRYKDTHHKRRDWWRKKAEEVGISTASAQWISRVAKLIHPTQKKPCKNCGSWMEIRYAYPSSYLLDRIRKLVYVPSDYELSPTEPILDLVSRLHTDFGNQLFADLPKILRTGRITPPALPLELEVWLNWIDREFIPLEPSVLSPGAMSNAPDRFDGFHSFNRCCREKADKGRHKTNLASYTTDRRVFEHWSEGDWIAADRLMGKIRTQFANETCLNDHPGPCDADHIGPLSLGFTHRPEFQLLCNACNSAKNNRMTFHDVQHLRNSESRSIQVMSWYGSKLWNELKGYVDSDETALRLSKILRDNRHNAILLLHKIMKAGYLTFLLPYLELNHADYNIEFVNLRVENHVTKYDALRRSPRTTKYAIEQKARRCRIAFQSLSDYASKPSRNALIVTNPQIEQEIKRVLEMLTGTPEELVSWDVALAEILNGDDDDQIDNALRAIIDNVPLHQSEIHQTAREGIRRVMNLVAENLLNSWNDARYVRSEGHFDDQG